MEYLLFICTDEPFTPDHDMEKTTTAWVDDVDRRGVRKVGDRLRPASDATTVRVRHDEVLISDGPFAETKEVVGGFVVVAADNLAQAVEFSRGCPGLDHGTVI